MPCLYAAETILQNRREKLRKTKINKIYFIFLIALAIGNTACLVEKSSQGIDDGQKSNAEIRQWYNDQVSVIPELNEQWTKERLGVKERARRAYGIRHDARIEARAMMQNKKEVEKLRKRDLKKYGNPDGPTFEYLVEKNRKKGLEGDEIYEGIISSSSRTNSKYNEKYGVKKVR